MPVQRRYRKVYKRFETDRELCQRLLNIGRYPDVHYRNDALDRFAESYGVRRRIIEVTED